MRDQRDPQELGLQIFQTRDLCKVSILEAADLVHVEFVIESAGLGCPVPSPPNPAAGRGLLSSQTPPYSDEPGGSHGLDSR